MLVNRDTRDPYQFPSFSIFSPEPIEKVEDVEDTDKYETFERPPSPLNEVIRQPPRLYEDFLEVLQDRVKPNPACKKLSIEHQEGLISIIFSEVYSTWGDLCESINDPHLKPPQNKKVHILLFINVVEICQSLFETYISKIDGLESKGVFSRSVNISRIKGSLIAEASKALNTHRLRQKILQEFKAFHNTVPSSQKSRKDDELSMEDPKGYFDRVLPKTLSRSIGSDLSKKISVIESKLRLGSAISDQTVSEAHKPSSLDPVVEETVAPSEDKEQRTPPKLEHQDSLVFRHRDLEFLLSDNRVAQQVSELENDEEELAAVLQASTKAPPPKRSARKQAAAARSRTQSLLSDQRVDESDLPVQPAITTNIMPDKTIVKTSDIRVSERVPQSDMILNLSPCLYNELQNEIDETDIAFLDRNLFMGQEIRDVYSEIYKTIDHHHLKFTSDMEPPCLSLPHTDRYFNSGILKKKKMKNRRINEKIKIRDGAPWGSLNRDEWEANVHFQGNESNGDSEVFPSQLIKVPVFSDWDTTNFKLPPEAKSSREGKSYTNWLQWWKSIMSSDDYLKYLSLRESDYLALVFHLYDSEEEVDSADERDLVLEKELMKEREKRDKLLQEMLEEKNKVVPGFWNANSIMMGGLGRDPELEETPLDENLGSDKLLVPLPSTTAIKRISRARSIESASTNAPAKSVMSKESKTLVPTVSNDQTASLEPSPAMEVKMLQERLNNIWKKLEMPESSRIDMTIKYCKFDSKSLKDVVDLWESACNSISSRESLILELETFEKEASDPQRLFGRNPKTSRIVEEKKRSALHRRIKKCEKQVLSNIGKVNTKLRDVVTYQGRVYLDKMSRDLTEMLYWLQQERRQAALEHGGMVMVDLPPMSPVQLI